jgi:alpha-glucosidase (family GH31 glycosyl hydrolase)
MRQGSILARAASLALALLVGLVPPVLGLDGVYHRPYGKDDIYVSSDANTDRWPLDPYAGQIEYIKLTTWPIESGDSVVVNWSKNSDGIQRQASGAWQSNSGNNSYWQAAICDPSHFTQGSSDACNEGDKVTYTVQASQSGGATKTIGPYSYVTRKAPVGGDYYVYLTSVSSASVVGSHVEISVNASDTNFAPKVGISFPYADAARVQAVPNPSGFTFANGVTPTLDTSNPSQYVVSTSSAKVLIQTNPWRLTFQKWNGSAWVQVLQEYDPTQHHNIQWDGGKGANTGVWHTGDWFTSAANEYYVGFGARYNSVYKRSEDVDTYAYNQYKNQGSKTYLPIPFYHSTAGYSLFVNSSYYTKFRLNTEASDMAGWNSDSSKDASGNLDYYVFTGTPKTALGEFTLITGGHPVVPPEWALGPIMSANEWNSDSKATAQLNTTLADQIPATLMVLEQWSDETTFYVWKDANFTPNDGSTSHAYSEFTYGTSWPNPKAFVDNLHNNHVRLILWNVPLNKIPDGNSTNQNSITEDNNNAVYMENASRKYAAWDPPSSTYYHNAAGWFPNAPFVDFTKTSASSWWLGKRGYLFAMGGGTHIDGFKTDGGEDIWNEDTTFTSDGSAVATKRLEHNVYPSQYVGAYYNYVQSQTGNDGITFARTGGIGAQLTPIYWAGDQNSDFGEYASQVRAAITAGASGVPFYGWDLAGFSGGINGSDIPTVELYDRSWPVAAFAPITQYHSENNGSDQISHARSPWNMQARTGDASVFNTGKKYANMRMNLLPYIWSSAIQTGQTGVPLMRALFVEYPTDTNVESYPTEYMLGDSFLVAPVLTQGATSQTIFLPGAEWVDFANGGRHYGGAANNFSYGVSDYSTTPIFVKSGSIVPMNLDATFTPGTWVGNDVTSTTNLTFVAYPGGATNYTWYRNRDGSSPMALSMTEDYAHHAITGSYPSGMPIHYWKIFTSQPSSVVVGGSTYTQQTSLANLVAATSGWYYDSQNQWLYVKNPASASTTSWTINGTDKAAFESEFGTGTGTCTATDHPGYTGTGFTACFDVAGRSQSVPVTVTTPGTYQLNLRYANGNPGSAIRTIYLDGNYFSRLSLPATGSWNTWSTAPILLSLGGGQHTIKVAYESDGVDTGAINLDSLGLAATPGPAKAFDHPEVLLGNNYYVAQIDRRGDLYDTQEPMGMYTGVAINDQNPTFNVSIAIHAQQGVAGVSLAGQDPQWLSGAAWSFSNSDYLTDTAVYQTTATNSSLHVTVTEQDFSPRGITFPTSTDTGNPPIRGMYVKRLSIQNTDTAGHSFDVSYWAHLSIDMEAYNDAVSCNGTDDLAFFNDPGGYGTGRDRTIAYGIRLKAPPGSTTSCTAYAGAALQKKTFTIGAGATQEVDILVAGATKTPASQSLYSSWIVPAVTWFNSNSMNTIQSSTQTSWTNQLAEASTLDSYPAGTDYNKVLHRALVLSLLHIDLTYGGVAAGFTNIGYPAMWPRDTAYGAMTLDRAGITDYSGNMFSFLGSLSRMSAGNWYQKYMLDGNPQWTQPQADETAIIPFAVYQHYLQTNDRTFLDNNWTMVQNAAAAVMPGASSTGYGWDSSSHLFFSNNIWEDTYGEFLYTNATIVAGLRAAANIATIEGNSTLATNWNNQANDIWNNGITPTITNGSPLTTPGMYDSDVGYYLFARNVRKTQSDGPALIVNPISADVSNLGLVWPFNLTPANDSKMVATASEVESGLGATSEVGSSGGVARYRHDQNSRYSPSGNPDYSPFNDTYFDGGPWTVATLWLADYKLARGQLTTGRSYIDSGKAYLDNVIGWMGPLYVGSEQIDHLAGQQSDGSWLKQAAWPNLWESNASLADTLMNLLDYSWNMTTSTLVVKPKIPSTWTAIGGNITIIPSGASSQKVYVKHQHPGGSSPDTVTLNNNTSSTAITIDLYVQTDFSPSSVTGLNGLTWTYDASSGRVRIQGSSAAGSARTITINR